MKRILPRLLFVFVLLFAAAGSASAQKNITIRVIQLSTTIGSCDFLGVSDPAWRITGGATVSNMCYETTCNGCTVAVNQAVFNQNYNCITDVPGTVALTLNGCEDDGAGCAGGTFVGICDGSNPSRTDNITLNTANGTYNFGPFCVTATGCAGTYCYWIQETVSGSFISVPANNDICAAINIPVGSTVAGNNTCATVQASEVDPSSGSISPSNTIWYSFTAPASGHVIVSTDHAGTSFDTEIAVYGTNGASPCPGTTWGNLVELGSNDDITLLFNLKSSVELSCLTPGNTYYIQVDGNAASDFGNVQVSVTSVGPPLPTNNNRCNALPLGALASAGSITNNNLSNMCANTEPGEPVPSAFGIDKTVWFTFTTPATPGTNTLISASNDPLSLGDQIDLQLAIYESSNGACNGTFTEINSDYDVPAFSEDMDAPCLKANTTYFLQVDGSSLNTEGYFGLTLTDNGIPAATNDDRCNAYNLGNLTSGGTLSSNTHNNFCADVEPGEPVPTAFGLDQTVWFKFTTAANPGVYFDINALNDPLSRGDQIDLQVAIYSSSNGACNGTMTEVGSDYDFGLFDEDLTVKCLSPSTTYWVQVDGSALNVEGYLGINVHDDGLTRAPNDLMCNATNLGTIPALGTVTLSNQNNYCGGVQSGEPVPLSFGLDQTVWYKFKPPPSGSVEIELLDNGSDDIDLQLAVWESSTNNCTGFFTEVDSYDDPLSQSITGGNKLRLKCLDTTKTYFIQVDGALWPWPLDVLVEGDFQISVHDYNVGAAPNDLICNAIFMGNPTGAPVSQTNQNNFCANNILEPFPSCFGTNMTVWYKFIAPSTGRVTISAVSDPLSTGDYIDLQLAVYGSSNDSCAGGVLFQAGCDYNDLLEMPPLSRDEDLYVTCLIPGKPYWIMVDGSDDPDDVDGWFNLTVTEEPGPPPITNDDICDAIHLGTVPGGGTLSSLNHHNFCATVEPGEPVPTSFGLDQTVWFTFIAPPSGNLTIHGLNDPLSLGDNIDLQLALWESSNDSCNGVFTEIRSDYDPGFFDEDLTITCLTPGRKYFLQVDGALWPFPLDVLVEGYFGITIDEDPAYPLLPTNDDICQAVNFGTIPSGGSTAVTPASNYCATEESGEPNVSGGNNIFDFLYDETVWFKYTTSATPGSITIDITNTNGIDAGINVYAAVPGSSCAFASLTQVGTADAILSFDVSYTMDCPRPLTTYYVQVDGLDLIGDQGTFDIQIRDNGMPISLPPNDSICRAVNMGVVASGGTITQTNQSNTCASEESGEPNVSGMSFASNPNYDESVWYTFTTSATPGLITINVFNTAGLNAWIGVYSVSSFPNCNFNALTEVDTWDSPLSNDAQLSISCLRPNTTYYIQVDGVDFFGDQGTFDINVVDNGTPNLYPSNDNICNATALGVVPAGGSTPVLATHNLCATEQSGEPHVSGGVVVTDISYDETVWYTFTTSATPGLTTIDISNTVGIDADIHVYAIQNFPSCAFANLVEIAAADDAGTNVSLDISCLKPNTTYYLQVDGVDLLGDQGTFNLAISDDGNANAYSPNDNICNATNLGVVPSGGSTATFPSGNFCASEELLELNVSGLPNILDPNYDETVWFSFTTSATPGTITVDVLNTTGIFASMNVYAVSPQISCAYPDLTFIRGNTSIITGDVSVDLVCLMPNTKYFVQVDGVDLIGDNGTFDIRAHDNGTPVIAPANNMVCNAVNLGNPNGGQVGPTTGNNNCANEEAGEPGVNGDDETVWYRFTAPNSGRVNITINSTAYIDANFSLYHSSGGCSFANFTQVGSNHDDLLSFSVSASEQCLIPGDIYYIQIDGSDLLGEYGNFTVTVQDGLVPFTPLSNDPCSGAVNLTVQSSSCQGTGTWQVFNYGRPTVSLNTPFVQGCGNNCGDLWYRFTMPASGTALVEGNDEYGIFGINNSEVTILAYSGPCNNLSPINCDMGGITSDPLYYVSGPPGATIYLQVFDNNGNAINTNFGLCVSDRCGADDCLAATPMQIGTVYCWDTDGANGETQPANPGYRECGDGTDPGHSVYFNYHNVCSDFELTITANVGGLCVLGEPTDGFAVALYQDNLTPCDWSPDTLVDCDQTDVCLGNTWYFNHVYTGFPTNTNFIIQIDGFDFTGDNDGTIVINENCVLPVDLLSFRGWNEAAEDILEWKVRDAASVSYFELERSHDGIHFSALGTVGGTEFLAGSNASSNYRYRYYDAHPLKGHNYYRLRMMNRDGVESWSNVVDIFLISESHTQVLAVYPNPAHSVVNVDMEVVEAGNYQFDLIDLYGRALESREVNLKEGFQNLTFDLSSYAEGVYFIRMQNPKADLKAYYKLVKED